MCFWGLETLIFTLEFGNNWVFCQINWVSLPKFLKIIEFFFSKHMGILLGYSPYLLPWMILYLKLETFNGLFSVAITTWTWLHSVMSHHRKGRGTLFLLQFPWVLVLHLMSVWYLMNHWLTLILTKFTLIYSIYHGDSLKSWLDLVSLTLNFKVSARLLKLGKKKNICKSNFKWTLVGILPYLSGYITGTS